jgi:hypothetical protein
MFVVCCLYFCMVVCLLFVFYVWFHACMSCEHRTLCSPSVQPHRTHVRCAMQLASSRIAHPSVRCSTTNALQVHLILGSGPRREELADRIRAMLRAAFKLSLGLLLFAASSFRTPSFLVVVGVLGVQLPYVGRLATLPRMRGRRRHRRWTSRRL